MNFARIISRLVENCLQTFILSRCIGQNYKVGGRLLAELECFLPLLPPARKTLSCGIQQFVWDHRLHNRLFSISSLRGSLNDFLQDYLGIFPNRFTNPRKLPGTLCKWHSSLIDTRVHLGWVVFCFGTKCTSSSWVCEDWGILERYGRRHWARHNCCLVGDKRQPSWEEIKEKVKHWYHPLFVHFVSLCQRDCRIEWDR